MKTYINPTTKITKIVSQAHVLTTSYIPVGTKPTDPSLSDARQNSWDIWGNGDDEE